VTTPPSAAFHAASRALDAAVDSVVDGVETRASGTTFVPADLARDEHIARYRKTGPNRRRGRQRGSVRPRPCARDLIALGLIVGAITWALTRRRSVSA
jgi:hypothetical protein